MLHARLPNEGSGSNTFAPPDSRSRSRAHGQLRVISWPASRCVGKRGRCWPKSPALARLWMREARGRRARCRPYRSAQARL